MDEKTLLIKYRVHFTRALALSILITGAIEIMAYFIFVHTGRCEFSFTDSYLLRKVVRPICLNCAIFFAVLLINSIQKINDETKNEVIVHGTSAVAFVISVIHREFIVNTGSFLFPMILSASFNDRDLITKTFVISLLSTTLTVVCSALDGAIDLVNHINYIVMYGFLVIAYFACQLSVKYSQMHIRLIQEQAKENAHLLNMTRRDSLTGLFNHKTFYVELASAIGAYKRNKTAFCLALIDIDFFKQINQDYGHDNANEALHAMAAILTEHSKPQDKAFRCGGEEFAVIFSGKTLEESKQLLMKMHKDFSDRTYDFATRAFTFSAGIASYPGEMSDEAFFDQVDKLLYKAKDNGRNQIQTEETVAV